MSGNGHRFSNRHHRRGNLFTLFTSTFRLRTSPFACPLADEVEDAADRAEIVQRQVLQIARQVLQVVVLSEFADELRLLDAVDPQVGFEIGIQFDHLGRVTGLIHHEVDHERRQFVTIEPVGGLSNRGHRSGGFFALLDLRSSFFNLPSRRGVEIEDARFPIRPDGGRSRFRLSQHAARGFQQRFDAVQRGQSRLARLVGRNRRNRLLGQNSLIEAGQDVVRSHFDEDRNPFRHQLADLIHIPNRRGQLFDQVVPDLLARTSVIVGHAAEELHLRPLEGDLRQRRPKRFPRRLQQRRVIRPRNSENLAAVAFGFQELFKARNGIGRAADHRLVRRIVAGQIHAAAQLRHHAFRSVQRSRGRQERAAGAVMAFNGGSPHLSGANRVFQSQHAGRHQRREFPIAVGADHVGTQADRQQHMVHHHVGEQHRQLRRPHVVAQLFRVSPADVFEPAETQSGQHGIDFTNFFRSRGNFRHQFLEHARILRALPGEQKRDPRLLLARVLQEHALLLQREAGARLVNHFRRQPQLLGESRGIFRQYGDADVVLPVEMILPAGLEQNFGILLQPSQLLHQHVSRRCGQADRPQILGDRLRHGFGLLRHRREIFAPFHQQVIAQARRRAVHDVGDRLAVGQRRIQFSRLIGDLHVVSMLFDGGNCLIKSGILRDLAVLHFQRGFQQRRHSRRPQGVTDLARHRAHHQRFATIFRTENFRGHFHFPGVDVFLAGAGRFEDGHLRRIDSRLFKGARGGRAEVGPEVAAVARRPHRANDAVNRIAVATGVGQPLEQDHAHAFGRHHAVRIGGIERLRRLAGDHSLGGENFIDVQIHVSLTGGAQYRFRGAVEQQSHGQVQRGHRRHVARVHRQGAAHQVERFRQPRRQRARREAARLVQQGRHLLEQHRLIGFGDRFDLVRRHAAALQFRPQILLEFRHPQTHLQLAGKVAAERRTNHHRRLRAIERFLVVSGFPQRLIGSVEQHELQRVGVVDLLRRNLVLLPIVDEIVHEAAQRRLEPPRAVGLRIDEDVLVPAVGRRFRFRIAA